MSSRQWIDQLLEDVRVLSAEVMEGRGLGTPGGARAREYLRNRLEEIGLLPWLGTFDHPSECDLEAVNLVSWIPGADPDLPWLVVLAHYDHLGIREGQLFPGADDNASGVGVALHVAQRIVAAEPLRSVILALPDGEEADQVGSRGLVEGLVLPNDRIGLVLNFDMMGRSDAGGLWVAGSSHHPELGHLLDAGLREDLLEIHRGHDTPDPADPRHDWTSESDHAAFHRAGLRWLYFGVEDHPDYHSPRDTFERLDLDFLLAGAEAVAELAEFCSSEPILEELESLSAAD